MTSNADITIRIQAISDILDKMSSCIDALTERLEQLTELRDEAECEFEIYSDESKERNAALEQYIEDYCTEKNTCMTETGTVLDQLFQFDSITPMTQPERAAVYHWILSEQHESADICIAAAGFLKAYRDFFRVIIELENIHSHCRAPLFPRTSNLRKDKS